MTKKLEDYLPLDGLGGTYSEEQARQAIANAEVGAIVNPGGTGGGGTTNSDFGVKITNSTMPTGGVGNLGWLSAIWRLISDRIPALSNGKIPVDGTFWQTTQPISAADLPLPSGAATSANQSTANISLANIDTKTPALGQALAAASTPVVLPAAQITALTPPTSVGITGTLPAFASTPTVNIGTAPNLTFTNTSFIANAGTNLNTSALALESGGNLAGINSKLPALSNGKIPVEVGSLNVSVNNASLEIANDVGNPIPISDAGGSITVDGSVSISNFPATQVVNTGLTQPLTDAQLRNTPVSVTGTFWQTTQPISAANLPLPDGAATSALQTTGNTSLANIDGKTPALGQALEADSIPVVLPASQITALTPPTTIQISGTLPGFADIPTVRLETQTQPMSVNATGELQESVNAMRAALNVLKNSIGHANPDTVGNIRVLASIPASQTLGTVTTLTTLTNQSQIGGFNAADHIPALMAMTVQGLRNNITVS